MSRLRYPLLFLGLVLTLAGVPASAQEFTLIPAPLRLICGYTATGAGPTVADAVANALNALKEDYLILSYTVVGSGCPEEVDAPGPIDPPVICWAEVRACAIRKAIILS